MLKYHEILRLLCIGYSLSNIALSTSHSRSTVSDVVKRIKALDIPQEELLPKTDPELMSILCSDKVSGPTKLMPDFTRLRKELNRPGVTKKQLWAEYVEEARQLGQDWFKYSQFCFYFQEDDRKNRATMHMVRKPAERLEVDWSGDTFGLTNSEGKKVVAHIFVATLSYSQYTYVEAFPDETITSWITGHIHAFEFYGGVARELIPDNCKTAVIENKKGNVVLNLTYREMSEHYNTIVIPARVRRPRDKASVEGSVRSVQQQVMAPLRNSQFFSLDELNRAIRNKLDEFNSQPFQKREGSRRFVFENEEKEFLSPLPNTRYELATWKSATVQYCYHVFVEKKLYSVPWIYIGKTVDVKITRTMVEVFFEGVRIASHQRSYNAHERYVTVKEHMPDKHQKAKWDGKKFREWALSIGESTHFVVDTLLRSAKVEQQAYRSCLAILNLSSRHSESLLELACKKVTESNAVSLKAVQSAIKALANSSAHVSQQQDAPQDEKNPHGITRGAEYFERSKS